jgi:hypothetical protein
MLTQLEIMDTVDRVSELSDDTNISAAFAALYLGMSEKSLSRLRQKGGGPAYMQHHATGSKARNQRVMYKMIELRSYQKKHTVTSSMEAAVLRGMALMTASALLTEQPFFIRIKPHGKITIIDHILSMESSDFYDYVETDCDKNVHTVWFRWDVALNACLWEDRTAHYESMFRNKYHQLLEKILLSKSSFFINAETPVKSHFNDD